MVYDESPKNGHFIRESEDIYRMIFAIRDVKVIIFPNEDTKQLALKSDIVKDCMSNHMPMMATLEDCGNF